MEEVTFQMCLKMSQRRCGETGEGPFKLERKAYRGSQRAEERNEALSGVADLPVWQDMGQKK